MDPTNSPKALKSLKIRFELSALVLVYVPTFRVAFGATLLEFEVEVEAKYQ